MQGNRVRALVIGLVLTGSALTTSFAIDRGDADTDAAAASRPEALAVTWDLPVRRTARVVYWEGVLAGPRSDKMRLWLERSGRYVPMIRAQLRARGMPQDLVYMALIESGFSPDAYSRARAAGLWQLMAATGQELGLEVGHYLDQRRDPVAATRAALDFLRDLHDEFGSWWLAAAAYNCGPARVRRALLEVTGKDRGDDADYWRIAQLLPPETRDYIPLIVAAGEIAKAPDRWGFDDLQYHAPLAFDSVKVPGGTRLSTVWKATGADSAVVDQLNPHYLRDITPPGRSWTVRIPEGLRQAFAANFPHYLAQQKAADARRAHRRSAQHGKTSGKRKSSAHRG